MKKFFKYAMMILVVKILVSAAILFFLFRYSAELEILDIVSDNEIMNVTYRVTYKNDHLNPRCKLFFFPENHGLPVFPLNNITCLEDKQKGDSEIFIQYYNKSRMGKGEFQFYIYDYFRTHAYKIYKSNYAS